jgi:hypothetical protein
VTWVKLSDDFAEKAARSGLSDAAFRTHIEALLWTMRRETGGWLRTRDIKRFAETKDPEAAVGELVGKDWWHFPAGDGRYPDADPDYDPGADPSLFVIVANMDDQPEPDVIEARRRKTAERVRRHRRKMAGLDSDDPPSNDVTERVTRVGSGRDGTGKDLDRRSGLKDAPDFIAPGAAGDGKPAPSQTRKRVHDGPDNHGPDDQHISNVVHPQSQATDRYAREARPQGHAPLPEAKRQEIIRLGANGHTYREIAAKTGTSIGTISGILRRRTARS